MPLLVERRDATTHSRREREREKKGEENSFSLFISHLWALLLSFKLSIHSSQHLPFSAHIQWNFGVQFSAVKRLKMVLNNYFEKREEKKNLMHTCLGCLIPQIFICTITWMNVVTSAQMAQPFHFNIRSHSWTKLKRKEKKKVNGVTTFNVCQIECHSLTNESRNMISILFSTDFSRLLIFI